MLKYHTLRDKVLSLKNLYLAFTKVKKNKSKAGLDKVSIQAGSNENLLNQYRGANLTGV